MQSRALGTLHQSGDIIFRAHSGCAFPLQPDPKASDQCGLYALADNLRGTTASGLADSSRADAVPESGQPVQYNLLVSL